jgi:intracellular septation protein A
MSVEATVSPPARQSERPHPPVRALLLAGGPRFVRDAFGPMLAFYLGWRVLGFDAGIAAATVLAIVGYAWERGQGRSGLSAAIGLGVAGVQAAAGLASTNTVAYFTPPLILNVAYGCAFLVSIFVGRPLAGLLAAESYDFSPQVRASATFRQTCSRISLAWAGYLFLASTVRLFVLRLGSVDLYVVVNVLTGLPVSAALMSWSIWYGARSLSRDEPSRA